MGSSRFQLQRGGAVQIYNFDKGLDPATGKHVIPVYMTDAYSLVDVSVTLTPEEAAAIAQELLEQAEALRLSEQ